MPCQHIQLPGGGTGIICGARRRYKKCFYCGKPGPWLCDWLDDDGNSCDRPICADHREHVGAELDFCKTHQNVEASYRG